MKQRQLFQKRLRGSWLLIGPILLLALFLGIWRVRGSVQAQEIYPELDALESLITEDEGKTPLRETALSTQELPPAPPRPGEPPQRRSQPFPPRMPDMMGRPLMMAPPIPAVIVVKNDNVFVLRGNQVYRLRASDLRIEAERTLAPGPGRTSLRIERFGQRRPEGGVEVPPSPPRPIPIPGPMPLGPPPLASLVVEGNNVFVLLGDQIFRLRANDLEIQAQQTLQPAPRSLFLERQREGRGEREERSQEERPKQQP